MRIFRTALLVFPLVLHVAGHAQTQDVSAQLLHAQYVAFGYETTQGFIPDSVEARTSATITPQDIEALSNVRQAMERWKRYIVVVGPNEADMLVAIRGAHHGSAYVGGRIGHVPTGSVPGSASGPIVGGDFGSPSQDYMAIYAAENGREGVQLWRKSEPGDSQERVHHCFKLSKMTSNHWQRNTPSREPDTPALKKKPRVTAGLNFCL